MARSNDAVVEALRELAVGDPFRVSAYEKTVRAVAEYPIAVDGLDVKDLDAIPAVGAHIAATVREPLSTGRIGDLDDLRSRVPAGLRILLDVPGQRPQASRAGLRGARHHLAPRAARRPAQLAAPRAPGLAGPGRRISGAPYTWPSKQGRARNSVWPSTSLRSSSRSYGAVGPWNSSPMSGRCAACARPSAPSTCLWRRPGRRRRWRRLPPRRW